MRFLVVTPVTCVHEHHEADPQRKGECDAQNQCSDSVPANTLECAEGITPSKQQHCKSQNDNNDLKDVGAVHFVSNGPRIISKIASLRVDRRRWYGRIHIRRIGIGRLLSGHLRSLRLGGRNWLIGTGQGWLRVDRCHKTSC